MKAGHAVIEAGGVRYVAITAGEHPTGGYNMEVVMVVRTDGGLHVTAAVIPPPADAVLTQALTNPALVVTLPAGDEPIHVNLVNGPAI